MAIKTKSLFVHIKDLFTKKANWDDMSDADHKSFQVYMVNRFLSMDMDYITLINMLQGYTMQTLKPKHVYNLYKDLLPKQNGFYKKYIKATNKESKFNADLIDFLTQTLELSTREVKSYLQMLLDLDKYDVVIGEYLKSYGKESKEIKKMLKVEKRTDVDK